jgi:hypothetical protein
VSPSGPEPEKVYADDLLAFTKAIEEGAVERMSWDADEPMPWELRVLALAVKHDVHWWGETPPACDYHESAAVHGWHFIEGIESVQKVPCSKFPPEVTRGRRDALALRGVVEGLAFEFDDVTPRRFMVERRDVLAAIDRQLGEG